MLMATNEVELTSGSWFQWQEAVLELLQAEFSEALHHISFDEVDWPSWQVYYHQGRTPRAAVDRALERDF